MIIICTPIYTFKQQHIGEEKTKESCQTTTPFSNDSLT